MRASSFRDADGTRYGKAGADGVTIGTFPRRGSRARGSDAPASLESAQLGVRVRLEAETPQLQV